MAYFNYILETLKFVTAEIEKLAEDPKEETTEDEDLEELKKEQDGIAQEELSKEE